MIFAKTSGEINIRILANKVECVLPSYSKVFGLKSKEQCI